MNRRSLLQRGMLGKRTGRMEADKEKKQRDEDRVDMIEDMLALKSPA